MQREHPATASIEEITRLVETGDAAAGPRLAEALDRWPGSQKLCLLSAEWHLQNGRDDEAVKALASGFKHHPEKQVFGFRLLGVHYDRGDFPQAGKVLQAMQRRFPKSSKLCLWAARLALHTEPGRVRDHLWKALDSARNPEGGALVVKECARLGRDGRESWELANAAIERWPESDDILAAAAAAAISAGENAAANGFLERLEQSAEAGADWRAYVGRALLQSEQFEHAFRVLQADGDATHFSLKRLLTAIEAASRTGDGAAVVSLARHLLHHPDAEATDKTQAIDAMLEAREYPTALGILEGFTTDDPALAEMMAQRLKGMRQLSLDRTGAELDAATAAALDDERREIHTHLVRGADTLLLVFTGLANKTAMPVSMMHTLLMRFGVSVVYLRDHQRLMGLNGYKTLAPDYAGSVAALKAMVPPGARLLCFGSSAGGYSALRYGLDLGAEKVIGMGAPTDLRPAATEADGRARAVVRRIHRLVPEMARDLRGLYEARPDRPRVELWYGAEMPQDRRHAENMRGLGYCTVNAIPNCDQHGVLWHLVGEERAHAVLEAFLAR